jgi:hypothetical protein
VVNDLLKRNAVLRWLFSRAHDLLGQPFPTQGLPKEKMLPMPNFLIIAMILFAVLSLLLYSDRRLKKKRLGKFACTPMPLAACQHD